MAVGEHDFSTTDEADSQLIPVKRIALNLHFHGGNLINDIALIELEVPVTFSSKVNPVLLPFSSGKKPGNSKKENVLILISLYLVHDATN